MLFLLTGSWIGDAQQRHTDAVQKWITCMSPQCFTIGNSVLKFQSQHFCFVFATYFTIFVIFNVCFCRSLPGQRCRGSKVPQWCTRVHLVGSIIAPPSGQNKLSGCKMQWVSGRLQIFAVARLQLPHDETITLLESTRYSLNNFSLLFLIVLSFDCPHIHIHDT